MEFGFAGGFIAVESAVGSDEEFVEGCSIEGIHGDAGADGERRIFALVAQAIGNALRDEERGLGSGFGKDEDELISAIAGSKIDFAGMQAKNIGEAAEGAAANQMSASVIYFF